MQRDARVAFASVPVAPVVFEGKESERDIIRPGLDFLQADDVRALALDPVMDLRVPRPDAVDVPGGDLQWLACAA